PHELALDRRRPPPTQRARSNAPKRRTKIRPRQPVPALDMPYIENRTASARSATLVKSLRPDQKERICRYKATHVRTRRGRSGGRKASSTRELQVQFHASPHISTG